MSRAGTDLIHGYLAELRAGLWVSADEAELIVAEAEDHLRETAAVGIEIGMTELEAHQAAISSFGPVRAVIRAHRRRTVTAGDAVMAAWKLTGLLATIVGAGGLATVLSQNGPPAGATGVRVVQDGHGVCQCSFSMVPITSSAMTALPFAAVAAGGLALLATRQLAARRLALRATSGRNPWSPAVTASFFLLVTALLSALNVSGVGAVTNQSYWFSPLSSGSMTATVPFVPGAIVAGCLAAAVGYGLQAALRLARHRPGSGAPARPGRDPLSPAITASFFLLVPALLFALEVSGVGGGTHQAWLNIPLSSGSMTAAVPLVPSAVVVVCLVVAAGYGLQAALRLARRGPGSGARRPARVLGQADRGGAGRAYV
ncbi:MAG: HAAS signaling domain-containing protein [Streptosporangiaceae bacterium]